MGHTRWAAAIAALVVGMIAGPAARGSTTFSGKVFRDSHWLGDDGVLDVADYGDTLLQDVRITGGRIVNSDPSAARLYYSETVSFQGVTLAADLRPERRASRSGTLWFSNGLTLDHATIRLNVGDSLISLDDGSLDGVGEIIVDDVSGSHNSANTIGGQNTVIGQGITVRTGLRAEDAGNRVEILTPLLLGTVVAETEGLRVRVVHDEWVNAGTLNVRGQGTLELTGPWTNDGVIAAAGGTLRLGTSGAWTNNSTITASGGAHVQLGGTGAGLDKIELADSVLELMGRYTTSQVRQVQATGSTYVIGSGGVLDNRGDTLVLGVQDGAWSTRYFGSIEGGVIEGPAGARLTMLSGRLAGVTLKAEADLLPGGPGLLAGVRIDGGLTLDGGRVRLRGVHSSYDSPSLESGDHLLLRGTGEIIFDGSGSESRVQGIQSTHIEAGVTVRTGNAGGVLGAPDTPNSNAGTILATRAGASITMRGEWTNDGVVRAPAGGGMLRLRGRFVNRSVLDSSDTVNDGTLSQREGSAFAGRLSGSGSVEVTGGQSLSAEYVRQSSLGVDAGGIVSLIGDAEATSVLGTLSLAEGSTLDVGRSRLIVKAVAGESAAAALARVAALVASARNAAAGRWLGAGITSSAARGEELRGLATIDGRDGEIGGQPVAAGDVVVAYTWNGDANVDGKVDADDYFRIDGGFLSRLANPLYTNGDFDYDGRINADDYFLIDSAFLGQTTPTPSPSHAVSVPESGVAVMLLAFLACAHGCRARTRSERDGRYARRI